MYLYEDRILGVFHWQQTTSTCRSPLAIDHQAQYQLSKDPWSHRVQ
jgi:hypothetical protein